MVTRNEEAATSGARHSAISAVIADSIARTCTASVPIGRAVRDEHGFLAVDGETILVGIATIVGWAGVLESRTKVEAMLGLSRSLLVGLGVKNLEFAYDGRSNDLPVGMSSSFLMSIGTAVKKPNPSGFAERRKAKARRVEQLGAYLKEHPGEWLASLTAVQTLEPYCSWHTGEAAARSLFTSDVRTLAKKRNYAISRVREGAVGSPLVRVAYAIQGETRLPKPPNETIADSFVSHMRVGRWYSSREVIAFFRKAGSPRSAETSLRTLEWAISQSSAKYEIRIGPKRSRISGRSLKCYQKLAPARPRWWKRLFGAR